MTLFDYLSAHPWFVLAYLMVLCLTLRSIMVKMFLYRAWRMKPHCEGCDDQHSHEVEHDCDDDELEDDDD